MREPPTDTGMSEAFPRDSAFDATLDFLREGYAFGANRCARLGSDAFETRLGGLPVVFARGADAAAMFYHPGRFTRRGALSPTTLVLLQDTGSVQQLDGATHLQRKRLFLRLLDADATARLVTIFREEWQRQAAAWERCERVVLHPQAELVLCRAACRWAGVPLAPDEAPLRARQFAAMIDGAGAFGPRWLRGWWKRGGSEHWIRGVVRSLRREAAPAPTPAAAIAFHRDGNGALLPERVAAVELINLLRPIVAVAR